MNQYTRYKVYIEGKINLNTPGNFFTIKSETSNLITVIHLIYFCVEIVLFNFRPEEAESAKRR